MNLSFPIFLAVGITRAAAKIGNYDAVDNQHNTIDEICAQANLPEYSKVAKLCKELGSNGLNMGMDETVFLRDGAPDKLASQKGPSFNMREILEAEDIEAAYNNIEAGNMMQTERKLVVDYGWCSSNAGFLAGISDDSSNYCDPSQDCDSSVGCGTTLSSCCITHDQCLNSGEGSISGSAWNPLTRCSEVNCKGSTCDTRLSSCAWNVSCCSFSFWSGYTCDATCVTVSTTISGTFGTGSSWSPQSGYNIGGDDADSICLQ
mmetsp:Transcript_25413/g.39983  ORF Transcript_25413/g.39983 Transcript_25413/m.39983 type:complete len:261 (-) Transcript_25413:120-902(-)